MPFEYECLRPTRMRSSRFVRTRACGRLGCKCTADPSEPHGPYWQWTRKVAARTVCRWLGADQAPDYGSWVANDRRLHELVARLEAIGIAALEADPRSQRRTGARTSVSST